jgi:hypothetical protein
VETWSRYATRGKQDGPERAVFLDRVPELCWETVADDRGDWWVGFSWWAMCGLVTTDPCSDFDVSIARRVSAGRRSGVDASVVVGFQDSFAIFSVMREISSVEPTVTVGFCGVMVGREGRASV